MAPGNQEFLNKLVESIKKLNQQEASRKLQKFYRLYHARQLAKAVKRRTKAVRKLQGAFRNHTARKLTDALRKAKADADVVPAAPPTRSERISNGRSKGGSIRSVTRSLSAVEVQHVQHVQEMPSAPRLPSIPECVEVQHVPAVQDGVEAVERGADPPELVLHSNLTGNNPHMVTSIVMFVVFSSICLGMSTHGGENHGFPEVCAKCDSPTDCALCAFGFCGRHPESNVKQETTYNEICEGQMFHRMHAQGTKWCCGMLVLVVVWVCSRVSRYWKSINFTNTTSPLHQLALVMAITMEYIVYGCGTFWPFKYTAGVVIFMLLHQLTQRTSNHSVTLYIAAFWCYTGYVFILHDLFESVSGGVRVTADIVGYSVRIGVYLLVSAMMYSLLPRHLQSDKIVPLIYKIVPLFAAGICLCEGKWADAWHLYTKST